MKMKKFIALILVAIMSMTMFAGCGSKEEKDGIITQEFMFETSNPDRNFEGEFPSELTLDGKTYVITNYSDIKFTTEGSEEMVEFWTDVNVEDLSEIPNKADFEYNGDMYTFDLSETILSQGDIRKTIKTTADYSNYISEPSEVPETTDVTVELPDGTVRVYEGKLEKVERTTDYEWRDTLELTGIWIGDPGSELFTLEGTDITVPYNAEHPTWGGYKTNILSAMKLDSDYYRVDGGYWRGEPYTDDAGRFVREASYYGAQYTANYVATYSTTYKTYGWSGQAAYRMNADKLSAPKTDRVTVYKLKAIVKYYLVETTGDTDVDNSKVDKDVASKGSEVSSNVKAGLINNADVEFHSKGGNLVGVALNTDIGNAEKYSFPRK